MHQNRNNKRNQVQEMTITCLCPPSLLTDDTPCPPLCCCKLTLYEAHRVKDKCRSYTVAFLVMKTALLGKGEFCRVLFYFWCVT